ncbi:unnamed protein product [Bemisia tabaci]|uniref:Uncharacterized protein n=1 Tax=Bemisia tabaci TaxID=7038 RepID=A0A9P0A143_BEMTA|nr:unnamed protein product [Bemisia tabaci]
MHSSRGNPTPQRNDSILAESIFVQDICVQEIKPQESFDVNLAMVDSLASEVYDQLLVDDNTLDGKLILPEVGYYSTAQLGIRLLDVKSKLQLQSLSNEEREYLKALRDIEFHVPQPFYEFYRSIGSVTDKMGKETYPSVADLPTQRAGGRGGNHSPAFTQQTHNLFEEVPC